MTTTVRVSSELGLPAEEVAGLLVKPALMRHVLWPVVTFPDLPDGYDLEDGTTVALRLLGVVPLWAHTIRVVHADPEALSATTEEHGGPVRRWRHHLRLERLGPRHCRYTDEVTLDAGVLTAAGGVVTRWIFRHRHRRWAGLARVLA